VLEGIVIKELSDMPAGVIGFEANGRLRAEDYRAVILPALERAAAAGEVRFVIVMRDFDGMSGGALWQDLKVGHRAPPGVEAHRAGDRHRVDAPSDRPVRLDDSRGDENLPARATR
jgi:hypothetical protein